MWCKQEINMQWWYARMMITMINDIYGFVKMYARCKSVFVFSDWIIAENGKVVKFVGGVSYD